MTAPEEIKTLRKSTGLTQEKFAAMIGVTGGAVSRWECGARAIAPIVLAGVRAEVAAFLLRGK